MKERLRNNVKSVGKKNSVSPHGVKTMDQMNYRQFGEDIDQISFEITCSYTEIYNEQIFEALSYSKNV